MKLAPCEKNNQSLYFKNMFDTIFMEEKARKLIRKHK